MLEVRPQRPADIEAVAELKVRSMRSAYAGLVPPDYLARLDPLTLTRQERDREVRVATRDERIVGFVATGPDQAGEGRYELHSLYVDPAHWGLGAGHALFTAVRRESMLLWVLEGNAQARRFYERQGLRHDGGRKLHTPPGASFQLTTIRYAS